ncbi:DUF4097 family beta strand repeat-containing protein [Streptomyces sp. NPDC089915]|uniref:DUF4097 family beta strand repeat-containing protein n=1 Tax=Streptomyces sp. NPDC089915 TaxID=3155186 RepID=UPI00344264D0
MPSFETPAPIAVSVEIEVGSVLLTAGGRPDTVVEVLPADPADPEDERAARESRVDHTDGTLTVRGPRKRLPFGRIGSVEVHIELPAGSRVRASTGVGALVLDGAFGACVLKSGAGDLRVGEAGPVTLRTGHGDVLLDRCSGDAEVHGAGRIALGRVDGAATVKNLNGETEIGEVTGDVRANSSNGSITVERAHGSVVAKSASGAIRVGGLARGKADLQTAAGRIDIAIRGSVAAWLDVTSRLGKVHNSLGPSEGPEGSEGVVEVRARTAMGDIVITRAA